MRDKLTVGPEAERRKRFLFRHLLDERVGGEVGVEEGGGEGGGEGEQGEESGDRKEHRR